jgi:hypothetical protein
MKIEFSTYGGSRVWWELGGLEIAATGETWMPMLVEIDTSERHWRCAMAHELAHLYIGFTVQYNDDPDVKFAVELLAWRVAKSYCKSEYWSDAHALRCLGMYHKQRGVTLPMPTEIVPCNWTREELFASVFKRGR